MASTRPNSDSVLIEKPSSGKTANVPISETGTASIGISVARQFCRNRNTTMTTRTIASTSVFRISLMPSRDRQRRVERVDVVEVAREARAQLVHLLAHARGDRQRVRAGRLEHRDADAGLAVDAADLLVVQRAELDARDVPQAHDRAVGVRAHDDVAELLRRLQPAVRAHRVGHLLAGRAGPRADLAGRVDGALLLDRAREVRAR